MAGSYLKIDYPPGVYRAGTDLESEGRWYDADLWRWHEGASEAVGGWRIRTATTPAVTGAARALQTWKDNAGVARIAIGTESHLYALSKSGTLSDITPTGFTPGRADATTGGGYGAGPYGAGAYGTPRVDTSSVLDASMWTLDTEGEQLVGCMVDDGKIYQWALDPAVKAMAVANAPTSNRAVIITAERFMVALGAQGNPRLVQWADQENDTVWTPSATNQAGQFPLQTSGRLMCGKRIQGGTMLFTDVDVWLMAYVGFPLVYGFDKVGDACGIVSQQAAASLDNRVVWMGRNGFYLYDGSVSPLPCEVADYVFNRINRSQGSKVHAFHNSLFSEVWWFYPVGLEIDSYVAWNYRENHWTIGALDRLSGSDRSVLPYPVLMGRNGFLYEHEVGTDTGGQLPRVRSGPIQLGGGDRVMSVRKLIADSTAPVNPTYGYGNGTVAFYTREYPNGQETVRGNYPLTQQTDTRFTARQVSMEFAGLTRLGKVRLEVVEGGKR